jgi:ubiquitin-protein ligase E3 C
LFVATPEQLLYPNPSYFAAEGMQKQKKIFDIQILTYVLAQQLKQFRFLGLIIGKAVYEGILLDVAFAEFFLKKCLGKANYCK